MLLWPRLHGPGEGDRVAINGGLDLVRVDLGVPLERILDALLGIGGGRSVNVTSSLTQDTPRKC